LFVLLILVTIYDGVSFTSLFIISCTCKHYRVPYNKAVHRVIKVDMFEVAFKNRQSTVTVNIGYIIRRKTKQTSVMGSSLLS
jgi:hypothetical protein